MKRKIKAKLYIRTVNMSTVVEVSPGRYYVARYRRKYSCSLNKYYCENYLHVQ